MIRSGSKPQRFLKVTQQTIRRAIRQQNTPCALRRMLVQVSSTNITSVPPALPLFWAALTTRRTPLLVIRMGFNHITSIFGIVSVRIGGKIIQGCRAFRAWTRISASLPRRKGWSFSHVQFKEVAMRAMLDTNRQTTLHRPGKDLNSVLLVGC